MDKLKKRISGIVNRILGTKTRVERIKWQGLDLKVLPGTIRREVDYDDAWYEALSAYANRIIDVGANVGYTAFLAFSTGGDKEIMLVDPNPEALGAAAENMFRNGFSDRTLFVCAFLSDEKGKKQAFYTIGTGAAGSMFADHSETARLSNSFYEVSTDTVDNVCDLREFRPDLIKVDVEGAESLVLNGAIETVKKNSPSIFIEMHSSKELSMYDNAKRILKWADHVGYRCWYLKEHEQLVSPQKIAHRGKCHLLLLPKSNVYPAKLKTIPQGSFLNPASMHYQLQQ